MVSDDERIIRLLAETRNRDILSILNDAARSLTVTDLAERLVARGDTGIDAADENALERVVLSLHHKTLPTLDDAGLVSYDPAENVVSYENYPSVVSERQELDAFDELLSYFRPTAGAADDTIGVVEGREDAIEYGRFLADEAENELFCMYVSTDLLEDECIRRAQNAIDSGVEMYIGSHNAEVRDLARERLPEATVWEPQFDWVTDPSRYPMVGRFVFADREKIMLSVLDEPDTDSETEVAIVGDGKDNPLVVLVRELLGSRLDHLDYQNEDLLDQLPFEP
ncbi:DUF7344 domain-containing protein [Halosolutus gelatinilyticus]|uniref:DUF7344 domain-containing protein n=1 Tax=Halosolutus gelatinilyticus TaxID=2931975 RepID=UPI001FF18441|nr:ArsR family transcriptional regulator [Halosolutus gelatinilyticus]